MRVRLDAGSIIVSRRYGQDPVAEQLLGIAVIYIVDARGPTAIRITAGHSTGAVSTQEQQRIGANSAGVAVGDIHQVVLSVLHGDHIPHVSAGAGAAVHGAGDSVAGGGLEAAQVTQVLEGLGVTLADHVGGRIVVKYPDDLPGISVGRAAVVHGCKIIGNQLADLTAVAVHLVIIRAVIVFIHDLMGPGDGFLDRCAGGGIHRIRTAAVFSDDREAIGDRDLGEIKRGFGRLHAADVTPGAQRLVIPIKLIGAVRQQGVDLQAQVAQKPVERVDRLFRQGTVVPDLADTQLRRRIGGFAQAKLGCRKCKDRGCPFTGCHLLDVCFQRPIDCQVRSRKSAGADDGIDPRP